MFKSFDGGGQVWVVTRTTSVNRVSSHTVTDYVRSVRDVTVSKVNAAWEYEKASSGSLVVYNC